MECAYCHNLDAVYEETQPSTSLKYCSYTCQAVAKSIDDDDHLSLYMNALTLDAVKTPRRAKQFGPTSNLPRAIPLPLKTFMLQCTEYIASLSLFEQYLVWRYTMGSASVNGFLIMGKVTNTENAIQWARLFFRYWRNTARAISGGVVGPTFSKFEQFFADPESLVKLSQAQALIVAEQLIPLYVDALDRIIRGTPRVKEGFHVYKVANDYPGLPTSPSDVPKDVKQMPFNSSTINPHFNFAFFTSPDSKGNLFDLRIPRGARVLYIPAEFHAYPFEKEILLPPNSTFRIKTVYQATLDVIDPATLDMQRLQSPLGSVIMGPVYEINQYQPCKLQTCAITKKPFKVFIADYVDK